MAIVVCGGRHIQGEIHMQGSKNAVLPILAATLLSEDICEIENCPEITDVHVMLELLNSAGAKVQWNGNKVSVDAGDVSTACVADEKWQEIRASVLLMGSLLSRGKEVKLSHPGGCAIGSRPIDFHLRAFTQMGIEIRESEDNVCALVTGGIHGAEIELPFPSVGATENILLVAVKAHGTTWIKNAAKEPEVTELCDFLQSMGARIEGAGTSHILVNGVEKLHGVKWHLSIDRIAFLTYGLLAAGCGGECFLKFRDCPVPKEASILARLGCELEMEEDGVFVRQRGIPKSVVRLCTSPYPGFPTDAQSPVMAVLTKGSGVSTIEEDIFDNRLRIVSQLRKMGANIDAVSNRAYITGVTKLHGANVKAEDLRSGAALLIAGAMAEGETIVRSEHFIHRGYENIVSQMKKLSINVSQISD